MLSREMTGFCGKLSESRIWGTMRQQATVLPTQPWHLQFQLRWSSSLPLTLCLDYNSSFLTSEARPSKAGKLPSGSPGMVILGTWSPNCEEAQASHMGWLHVGVVTNRLPEVFTHRERPLQMWVFTCFLLLPQDTLAFESSSWLSGALISNSRQQKWGLRGFLWGHVY